MDIVGRILGNDDLRQWEMNVDSIFLHSDFVSKSPYSDDLALIKLSHPVPNSTTVQPITLPSTTSSKFPSLGQLCVTKGWGCTELGGSPSSRAREIQVPIYSFDMCYTHFRLSTSDKQLCAGYLNRNIGICRGDSGSPLVCKSGSQHTLAGVVSFGSADNPDSFPAVFTRVQSYVQWINDVIAQNG